MMSKAIFKSQTPDIFDLTVLMCLTAQGHGQQHRLPLISGALGCVIVAT